MRFQFLLMSFVFSMPMNNAKAAPTWTWKDLEDAVSKTTDKPPRRPIPRYTLMLPTEEYERSMSPSTDKENSIPLMPPLQPVPRYTLMLPTEESELSMSPSTDKENSNPLSINENAINAQNAFVESALITDKISTGFIRPAARKPLGELHWMEEYVKEWKSLQ